MLMLDLSQITVDIDCSLLHLDHKGAVISTKISHGGRESRMIDIVQTNLVTFPFEEVGP